MLDIDDALMALIMRFVVDTGDDNLGNESFLKCQLRALRKYLVQFPSHEHADRAMEWIGQHAARYRQDWEHQMLANRTVYLRCADCPLADVDAADQCEIHEQWLYLLHRYLEGETMTADYVEDCLSLLREYKAKHARRLTGFSLDPPGSGRPRKGKPKGKR